MYDIVTILLGIVGMFVIVGGVAFFFQNRARKEGNLFTQPASVKTRILAFIFGMVFTGFFLLEIFYENRFHIVMPFLAALLFAYALGFNRFIKSIQKDKK